MASTIKQATIIKEDGSKISREISVAGSNVVINNIEGLEATTVQEALEEIEGQLGGGSSESGYLNKTNPTGFGSLSLNRKSDSTVGDYSVAVGNDTTATGPASVAEGSDTVASGIAAHASGSGTTASGNASFAAGTATTASQTGAAAFGGQTTASGAQSFAIGNNTTASGTSSIAAGTDTAAIGFNSSAFGKGTVASNENSFVVGTYNSTPTIGNDEKVLFEVGNGNSSNKSDSLYVTDKGIAVAQNDFKLADSDVSMTSLDTRVADIEDALEAVFASDEVVF